MEIKKILKINELLDLYGSLLTDKQRNVMELYYKENLSLAEIGEEFDISRQAVYDTIKKSESSLYLYEENLGMSKLKRSVVDFKDTILQGLCSYINRKDIDKKHIDDIYNLIKICEESIV